MDGSGHTEEEKVVSSIVVFGRRVDGVDIVGPGSKIALYVANDGMVFGFDGDWPRYERTAQRQDLGWRESQLINMERDSCLETGLSRCIPGLDRGQPGEDE